MAILANSGHWSCVSLSCQYSSGSSHGVLGRIRYSSRGSATLGVALAFRFFQPPMRGRRTFSRSRSESPGFEVGGVGVGAGL